MITKEDYKTLAIVGMILFSISFVHIQQGSSQLMVYVPIIAPIVGYVCFVLMYLDNKKSEATKV